MAGLRPLHTLALMPAMKLICHPLTAFDPPLRPASSRRPWMDDTPQGHAYRCLPLVVGNQHGWEVFTPSGFTARWTGGDQVEDVSVHPDTASGQAPASPMSNFGSGILTFEMGFLLRTPPGWNIWVQGPVNGVKDGVAPLSGVIETDWSPYSFTMNWRFTRPGEVRFEADEAIAHIFPVRRDLFDKVTPEIRPIQSDPKTARAMEDWRLSRADFAGRLKDNEAEAAEEKWQKGYYRGLMPDGAKGSPSHKTKLHVKPFTASEPGRKRR